MKIAPALLPGLLVLSACGSPKSSGPEPITIRMESFTVLPGEELTRCQVVYLRNEEPFDFKSISSAMAEGSHHLILSNDGSHLVPGIATPAEGFGPCTMGSPRLFIYGAQESVHSSETPKGVAGQLPRNAVLILEAHYANASSVAMEASAEVIVEPATGTITQRAGMLFFVDRAFEIPGGAGMNETPPYTHTTTCQLPEAINVFRLGSHTHKRLDRFEIHGYDGMSPGTRLYENTDWHAPKELSYPDEAPLQVPANGGFTFTCGWYNETADPITFGPSVDDEMCIMGAGYYPRIEGPLALGGVVFCLDGTIYY